MTAARSVVRRMALALAAIGSLSACATIVPPSPDRQQASAELRAPARSMPSVEAAPKPAPRPSAQPKAVPTPAPKPRAATRQAANPPSPVQQTPPMQSAPPPRTDTPTSTLATAAAPTALQNAITALGSRFDGNVAIAVRDVNRDWVVDYNGRKLMPQQSVSKLWVATTLLDKVDSGERKLDDTVLITRDDLTLFNQPIAQLVGKDGYRTTLSSLLERALTQSDNTANDSILRTIGGPSAVRAFLARKGIADIRFGPGERLLQSATAGLTWKQEYSVGRAFYTARANLPMEKRQSALDRYLTDPPDGASAIAMVNALAKLKRGELFSQRSTDLIIATMRASRTGPNRLRGGIAPGWTLAHKTGTGQDLAGLSTGYNDVGLLTAPDGTTYAVAVLIGSTRRPIPERMALMQAVTRAVIAYHTGQSAVTITQ